MSLNNLNLNLPSLTGDNTPSGEGYDITTPYGEVNIGFEHSDCDVYLTIYPFEADDLETMHKCEEYVKTVLERLESVKRHVNSCPQNGWQRDSGGTGLEGFYMPICIYEEIHEMLNGMSEVSKVGCRPV